MSTPLALPKIHSQENRREDIQIQAISIDELVYQNASASTSNSLRVTNVAAASSSYQPSLEMALAQHEDSSLRQVSGIVGADSLTNEEEESYPDGGRDAWMVVLGSFLGLTFDFGLINSLGTIQTYISTHQLVDVPPSTVSWIFSILLTTNFGFCLIGGTLFDHYGSRLPMTVGMFLSTAGLLGTASSQTVYQFILSFGVCTGLGLAFLQTPLFCLVSHWFSQKRAMAAGLATLGVSVGGVVLPLLLSSLYTSVGFSWAIRVLALLCFVSSGISIWLTKERFRMVRASTGPMDVSQTQHQNLLARIKSQINNLVDLKAFKNPRFTLCALGMAGAEVYLITAMTYFSSYAVAQGVEERTAYLLITVINASGIIGRFLPGVMVSKFGCFNVITGMLLLVTLSIFTLWLPLGNQLPILYAFAALLGVTSASILCLAPVCLAQVTPIKSYGRCYAMVFLMVAVGNLVFIPVSGILIGNESRRNYNHFVLFCGLLSVLVTICFCGARYSLTGKAVAVRV